MKKKVLAAFIAATVLSMGSMTAFAAESPTASDVAAQLTEAEASTPVASQAADGEVEGVTNSTMAATSLASGSSTGLTIAPVADATVESANAAAKTEILNNVANVANKLGKANLASDSQSSNYKVTVSVLTVKNVDASNAVKGTDGKYTVKLNVAGVASTDAIAVLHYNGTDWEVIVPTAVGDGNVTFKADNLSPISIVKLTSEKVKGDEDNGDNGSDSSTTTTSDAGSTTVVASPKTGEGANAAAVILTIGAAGAVVVLKKRFA